MKKIDDLITANLSGMPSVLAPEVRVDKNGVPVTRHVRQQKGNAGKELPKPAVTALEPSTLDPERESDIEKMFDHCQEFFDHGNISTEDFLEALNGYSDHTIHVLKQHMGDDPGQTYYAELTALIGGEYSEREVREYVMYSYEAIDCEDLEETSNYIKGLRHYKEFNGIEDFTRVDKDAEASARALIRIAFHLHCMQEEDHPAAVYVPEPSGADSEVPVIKSPSLVSLVVKNPSRSGDIASYIEENNFKSTKTLSQMIEGTHHATREGFL